MNAIHTANRLLGIASDARKRVYKASYPLPPLSDQAAELKAHRQRQKKRPMALRRAERDLTKVFESLKLVGYQPGDEVYHSVKNAIAAVKEDFNAISK
jgi:hypothetical protein